MIDSLPAVNATLNVAAACLLFLGWIFIRRKQVAAHRACMIAAFVVSAMFLACYLAYHFQRGSRPFPGHGIWRTVYFLILVPHIFLAMAMLPPIYLTFRRAFAGDFERHRRIARPTLAVWIYVSATGVLVYLMLYQMAWQQQ